MIKKIFVFTVAATLLMACKKKDCTKASATNYNSKAKKDDGSCQFDSYTVPTTYVFKDANGTSTVSYGGQTERLMQLEELVAKMKSGTEGVLSEQDLLDMFANTGGNGSVNFF